jgi:hypothetical protein
MHKLIYIFLMLNLVSARAYSQSYAECSNEGLCPSDGQSDGYIAPAPTSSSRFILFDRPSAGPILKPEVIESTDAQTNSEIFFEDLPNSNYSPASWNKVRQKIETGKFQKDILPERIYVAISTNTPIILAPEVEFKSQGTSLSVTGRKIISFNYSGKKYLNEQKTTTRSKSLSLFEINQQLQVRMQGKVGNKINVNVDYDDTKEDRQDISVVYQGDPQEVVQNISFGDINLSLPSTEFVSYNKQLFGIRADLKTKNFSFTFIGSRTKGKTKTKQFTGNTQFQASDISDINYMRRKYYDLTFGNTARLPLKPNSEIIYIDRQQQAVADEITIFTKTVDDLNVQTSTYTGKFEILNPGLDYNIDYIKGILTFNRTLGSQETVIIDFTNSNGTKLSENLSPLNIGTGGSGRLKLVKTQNDIYISDESESGWERELKTYYSIGQMNIVRDDGRGMFTLKVQDLNRNDVGANLSPEQTYPNSIHVDFEQGTFYLDEQFSLDNSTEPDTQIYAPSPVSKRIIRVEYYHRFKTFMLEPNIVTHSESVIIDNIKFRRNEAYFIDYDSGFITFYYPEKIKSDSKIVITYEVAPFGGGGNLSLIGGRVSYDLGSHLSVGSSLLYQGGMKTNTVPNITDLTNSMMVYEGDVQLKSLNLLGLRTNLKAEAAQSRVNPNLNDFALIDNMEGIKQEDTPSLDHNFWYIASNPTLDPADPLALTWTSEDIKSTTINSDSTSDGDQQVLTINYDFNVSSEVSIVYPISNTGLDFSQKNTFEIVVYGENSIGTPGPQINFHLGQINEDADGTGGQSFTCSNGINLLNAPKNEDLNCDGQLSNDEDIGWLYKPANVSNSQRYGADNGRMDSTDLNRNGRIDSQDYTGGDFGYVTTSTFIDNDDNLNAKNKIDFNGWHTLYTSLNIASTDTYKWNAIKQVRLSLKQTTGGATSGVIKIARISAVGNTWNISQSTHTGTMEVLAVNNVDNPGYIPIYNAGGEPTIVYNDLYGSAAEQQKETNSDNLIEQALSINYSNITSTSTVYVYRKYTQAINIAQHEQFKFLIYSSAASNSNFYLRLGDENIYQKVSVPLNFTGWRLITLNQEDLNGDNIPDIWTNGTNYNIDVSTKGILSLQQVPMISAGIETSDLNSYSGTVYINEIHLAKPLVKTGNARKIEGSFDIPGWMSFGGKHRIVDKNFQTPVSAISNQDNELNTGYLNLTKLRFFPINVNVSNQLTDTPNTLITGNNNLVNSLQQGKVKKLNTSASGNFNYKKLPKIGLSYSQNKTDYDLAKRQDETNTYGGNLTYNMPFNFPIFPRNINLDYGISKNQVNYNSAKLIEQSIDLTNLYNTDETSENYGAKLSFIPWKGSSFNPSYNLKKVKETRFNLSNTEDMLKYPKSLQQTVSFNSNFRFFDWLNPSLNYSVNTMENNNLSITTVTVLQSSTSFNTGEIKTIKRTAQGALNLSLNMNKLMPRNKLLRSMIISSNYQLQDGDSWDYVEKGYNSQKNLWIRQDLKPTNSVARRSALTLRDTYNSTQRWQPFEGYNLKGRFAPFSTISLTNNFTNTVQRSEITQTKSKTISRTFPDVLFSMSKLETLTKTEKWAKNATLNFKFSKNKKENINVNIEQSSSYGTDLRFKLLNFLDTAISYNLRLSDKKDLRINQTLSNTSHNDLTVQGTFDIKKFRFTPKVDYSSDLTESGLGVITQDSIAITPSLLMRSDFKIPKGLRLPFMKNTLAFTNRIVWTTTLSYAIKKSPITIAENSRLFSLNTTTDYEATKNLRVALNASIQRLWHKYLKQEEYLSYQIGSSVTFQF